MFKSNKALWDKRTDIHVDSDFYDMESFKKGRNALKSFELEILGDVNAKTILHLQCHFGQDTLSLARMGANVTGLDFSENAIEKARLISKEMHIQASFVCCNVLEMDQYITDKFDLVFASYGICGWLPDLEQWGKLIADRIVEGGRFVIVDFHPVLWMFDDDFKYSYFNKELIAEEPEHTYTDKTSKVMLKSFSWNHSISEIISALIKAGLTLKRFNEYDYSPYECFNNLVEFEEGKYQVKGMEGKLPMVYALEFIK
ncbi:methyltransferase domain-containing protein [Elizabethkingia argentiflava]|uniref:Methyltransferase domain-containing protein n=1 Tax=Elizabethkingia argenteiflava TaxID=2681556 RepID=A0A845PUM4_9FLAO|nr:class I SAM-dependent methyltransferase [Elizabethkingia argenteiflava]NAW50711.1 methyltransferase domain-containing protein [Elizabethkingia argenteiflava]